MKGTTAKQPIPIMDQDGEGGRTSTIQVLKPEVAGGVKGRRKLAISPLVSKKFYEWLRSSRSKIFKRKMLPIAGLQRYYQKRKDAYVARGGSPDAFDQAFDDVDIAVAVDGWSSLDAELAKHLHEDIGKREEAPTAKELKEMVKSHEEQEREIDEKYAQYVADLEKGTSTSTPVRPSLSPEERAKLDFDFQRWEEQRSFRYAKPKEKWTEQDKEFMGWTFAEWKDKTEGRASSPSRKGPSPSATTKGESENKAKDLFTGRTLDGHIEASRTRGLDHWA
jgi:hypothetical protein